MLTAFGRGSKIDGRLSASRLTWRCRFRAGLQHSQRSHSAQIEFTRAGGLFDFQVVDDIANAFGRLGNADSQCLLFVVRDMALKPHSALVDFEVDLESMEVACILLGLECLRNALCNLRIICQANRGHDGC